MRDVTFMTYGRCANELNININDKIEEVAELYPEYSSVISVSLGYDKLDDLMFAVILFEVMGAPHYPDDVE